MPYAAEKLMFENPQREARGRSTTELWEVYPTDGAGVYDPNGVVNPREIFVTGTFPVNLPQYGDSIPNYGLCVGGRVAQVVGRTSVIVAVFYRTFGLFVGGPRPISTASAETRYVHLPVWNQRTDGVVTYWEYDEKVIYPRMVAIREETRFIPGGVVSAVQNAIAINAGTLWTIDGLLYRLSDKTSARYDGGSYTRAEYRFERDCEIPAIPADPGGTLYGNGVLIPALPALYSYSSRPDPTNSANPPQIRVVPPAADLGGPAHTPAYPALPGFP